MRAMVLTVASVLVLGSTASAQTPAPAAPQAAPSAVEAPQGLAPRPLEVRNVEVDGGAVVECSVLADRTLSDCVVVSETPPGKGFGNAALLAAAHTKVDTLDRDGKSTVGRRVRIPLSWKSR